MERNKILNISYISMRQWKKKKSTLRRMWTNLAVRKKTNKTKHTCDCFQMQRLNRSWLGNDRKATWICGFYSKCPWNRVHIGQLKCGGEIFIQFNCANTKIEFQMERCILGKILKIMNSWKCDDFSHSWKQGFGDWPPSNVCGAQRWMF
jgi:hypothetical protein